MSYRRYQGFSLNPIWIIIAINLLMLVTTIISPKLISLLGLVPAISLSRPWTIVTNLFIHGGLWHLLANMLTLYFFGRYLTRLIGDSKLLIVYFAGGPNTCSSSALGSCDWRFPHTLFSAIRSMAGSPRRFNYWSHSRLYLQKEGALFPVV